MELAFLTPLLKDGAKSVSRGVAINDEWFIEMWLAKDRCGANGVNEGIECGFMFIFPMEFASLCTMGDKCVEWGSEHAEIANIHAIKVEKAQECAEFPQSRGSFPVFDAIHFHRIHSDTILTDDNAKVLDFRDFELAFLRFEV